MCVLLTRCEQLLLLVRKGDRLITRSGFPKAVEERILALLIPFFTADSLHERNYKSNARWYAYAKIFLAQQLNERFTFSTYTLFSDIKRPKITVTNDQDQAELQPAVERPQPQKTRFLKLAEAQKKLDQAVDKIDKEDLGKTFLRLKVNGKSTLMIQRCIAKKCIKYT